MAAPESGAVGPLLPPKSRNDGTKAMEYTVRDKYIPEDDHLAWHVFDHSDFEDRGPCSLCGDPLLVFSSVVTTTGDNGLETGICQACGYIRRTRNLRHSALMEHFQKTWLSEKTASMVPHSLVYQVVKPYMKDGRAKVLDVGCGLGGSLHPFFEEGHEVHGFEPSEHRCREAARHFPNITCEGAETFFSNNGSAFDVIYLNDVIQFIVDPFHVLEQAASSLTDGGLLLLKMGTFGHKLNFAHICHLAVIQNYLSSSTVQKYLAARGLELIHHESRPYVLVFRRTREERGARQGVESFSLAQVMDYKRRTLDVLPMRLIGCAKIRAGRRYISIERKRGKGSLPVQFVHNGREIPVIMK